MCPVSIFYQFSILNILQGDKSHGKNNFTIDGLANIPEFDQSSLSKECYSRSTKWNCQTLWFFVGKQHKTEVLNKAKRTTLIVNNSKISNCTIKKIDSPTQIFGISVAVK